ncbi:tRNA-uridine aminocarboxypropyltransferase 1 [Halyomorpha halys]|uniref:tRNA-uridine aminocarboxypropyltransferase 1 n=1 Tax=Halyomorpha halys TaxID=286706 RepID=UPI0006D50B6E|nr:DTW domain-containing protein 1 [Halyomorpha halys]
MEMDSVEGDPFKHFSISDDWCKLLNKDERDVCPKCTKSRMYFCYTCYVPMNEFRDITPRVKLPLRIDIIKHPKEIDGKSTAVHAAIISPDDVNMYIYPSIPNYNELSNVILIFPSKDAFCLEEAIKQTSLLTGEEGSEQLFNQVVFIDSTWNQCRTILNDSRIKGLPRVVLKKRESQFWRHQKGSPITHLATIEAIHQFLVEYYNCTSGGKEYDGRYDNILFFFKFMYHKIHSLYDHNDLLSYKRPMLQ